MNPERAIAYRKQVSALLEAVLAEDISPRVAINAWPAFCNEDQSVRCAYTMLWFFEADEDRHQIEMFYTDVQLQNMREAYQSLRQGEPLSQRLLQEYAKSMAPSEYHQSSWLVHPLRKLQGVMQMIRQIVQTNPWMPQKQSAKAMSAQFSGQQKGSHYK